MACAPVLYAGFDPACGFSAQRDRRERAHAGDDATSWGTTSGSTTTVGPQAHIDERAFTHGRYATPEPYSYGWVNPGALDPDAPAEARWHTAMAYDAQCWVETAHIAHELHGVCRMLNRFSSPALTHNGAPTGQAGERETGGIEGPADAGARHPAGRAAGRAVTPTTVRAGGAETRGCRWGRHGCCRAGCGAATRSGPRRGCSGGASGSRRG